MLINFEWLKDWVDIDGDAERLAEELTTAGLEVEAVTPVHPGFAGVVVARIDDVQPHAHADRLSVCRIDDGSAPRTVVCGAPNAAAGLHVAYAGAGARLPGGRTIEASEIRGVASQGMLCSARELGLADDAGGLLVLDGDAPVGAPLERHLRLAGDAVLDVNITPNRGDCLSALGIAREVAAIRGRPLGGPAPAPVPPDGTRTFAVELAAGPSCPRFAGRVVEEVDIAARTPDWLTERLRRSGLRAIHPVVDVTNYVMLELGQPLHAYSLDALVEPITVRFAAPGEQLTLLDGKSIELDTDVLIIADAEGPVGLAGIMGGARTAVTASTRNVFFESAFFAPAAIHGRARRYGLHTDASLRFERGVDPTQQERAVERATELLHAIAAGRAGPTAVADRPADLPARPAIDLRPAEIEAVLGIGLADRDIGDVLDRLRMGAQKRGDSWSVVPPPFRFDLELEADLIEELARLTGYDNIPAVAGAGSAALGAAPERRVGEDAIADTLVARGYSEAVTYGFIDPDSQAIVDPGATPVRLANPISAEFSVMRGSLWPGLLRAAQQNMTRQRSRLRLFEVGTEFAARGAEIEEARAVAGLAAGEQWPEHWDGERRHVDFFDVKGDVEALLALTGAARDFEFVPGTHAALNPSQAARIRGGGIDIGWIGTLHPRVQKHFELKTGTVLFTLQIEHAFASHITSYSRFSKFPSVRRDLAVVVPEEVSVATLVRHAHAAAGELLQSVVVFDLYRGGGIDSSRKSIGLGLILQDVSRTLTDEDAGRAVDAVMHRLEHELGATIRT